MLFSWRETATWIPLLEKTQGHRQTPETIVQAVRDIYEGVTVFHAAHPQNVHEYYEKGLQLADQEELTSIARNIFRSGEFPEIDERAFLAATERFPGIDNGKVYVSLDEREQLTHSGHYLVYGSEHICGIAAFLSRNKVRDYRQILKRFGRPTIFTISLPLDWISESDILQFGQLLQTSLPRIRSGRRPPGVDVTFTLQAALPGNYIIAHYHPDTIMDPLTKCLYTSCEPHG